jgi:beta-N-acetylhexosaminidase
VASGASLSSREPRAAIFGCSGATLTPAERDFFRAADPLGFILFQRNCDNPDQLRRLVAGLRDTVGRADAPVLIDQEGGRVARLKPPHWPAYPAPAAIAALGGVARRAAHRR